MASGSAGTAAVDGAAGKALHVVPEMLAAAAGDGAAGDAHLMVPNGNPPKETLMESIKRLKDQQMAMKAAKMNLQKELKNACKRSKRLKKRARQLTDNDLVEVLRMRKDAVPMQVEAEPTAGAAPDEADGGNCHMCG